MYYDTIILFFADNGKMFRFEIFRLEKIERDMEAMRNNDRDNKTIFRRQKNV